MPRRPCWILAGPALAATGLGALGAAPVHTVIAAEYLTLEAAQKSLYPQADRFAEVALSLSPEQRARVAALAGPQPPHRSLRAWKATRGATLLGYVFVDEVIGREQFITYALAIDTAGKLGTLEVMAYRESHGEEIRGGAWRHQFDGRRGLDELRFGTDIKNIAGATLSCEHVTQGVRWIDALWQVSLGSPDPAA
jgi:Na+-translocating ferredoxin:NAD+ oxidoreductase subunit G